MIQQFYVYTLKNWKQGLKENTQVHSSITSNNQRIEATQVPTER